MFKIYNLIHGRKSIEYRALKEDPANLFLKRMKI
jgi:hypothetical protein